MRVLLLKTSSMGDVIHALPALTDAMRAIPNIKFDWVVEESFSEIPAWHPAVANVIPVSLRKWRKNIFSKESRKGFSDLRKQLNTEKYDMVLDAQGLVKSAFLGLFARGTRVGLDFRSAREWPAAFFYQKRCRVNFYQHAVDRMRQLFSLALNYELPKSLPDFGLDRAQFSKPHPVLSEGKGNIVFLHATTWNSKQWPESYWVELAKLAGKEGYQIKTSGGNPVELARSARLAKEANNIEALPRLKIAEMATLLANSKAVVAVDTGFAHLAAALNLPTISIYGSTNPDFTGVVGQHAVHLAADYPCAPCYSRECKIKEVTSVRPVCYSTLPPSRVWQAVWIGINGSPPSRG